MNKLKQFYHNHMRTILTTVGCLAMILMVAIIAANSSSTQTSQVDVEGAVQTSAPTTITFVMPIENGTIIKDYSNTMLKYNSTLKQWESHKGVDIKGTEDAPVRAAYAGEVVSVENNYLTGTVVVIKHINNLQTVYGSLDENVNVKAGVKVSTGQVIGKVSTSAKGESADGAHLHFEVIENNIKVDPNLYLENANISTIPSVRRI